MYNIAMCCLNLLRTDRGSRISVLIFRPKSVDPKCLQELWSGGELSLCPYHKEKGEQQNYLTLENRRINYFNKITIPQRTAERYIYPTTMLSFPKT